MLYWISQGDFNSVIQHNAQYNSAPPLFALLINFVSILGNSEAILRGIPAMAGVVSIPVFFVFARLFFNRKVSYLVTFLVALSGSLVVYSQQVREYSLTFLTATLILIFFIKFINNPEKKGNTVGLTLTLSFGISLQYGIALLVLALNLIVLWFLFRQYTHKEEKKSKRIFLLWFSIQPILLILTIFDYVFALSKQLKPHGFGANSESDYLANAYWDGSFFSLFKLAVGNTYDLLQFTFLGVSLFVLLCFSGFIIVIADCLPLRGDGRGQERLLLLLFGIPLGLTFFVACLRLYPYQGDRQLFFLTPMVFILAGYAISYLQTFDKKRVFTLLVLGVVIWGGLISNINYLVTSGTEDIRPAVQVLREEILPKDRIYIFNNSRPAFDYYYPSNNIGQRIYSPERGTPLSSFTDQMDQLLTGTNRLWLVFSHTSTDEFKFITDDVSKSKKLELIYSNSDVYLYLVK